MNTHEINHRFGKITIQKQTNPSYLLVQAKGYVNPKMLQATLAIAEEFGREQPQEWDYIVDTTELKVAHPLNPIWLRKIHKLPHLNRYIVINPPFFLMRLLSPLIKLLLGPDIILNSIDELDSL